MDTSIIRGTTPLIKYNFSSVNVADIAMAYLVIKQNGAAVVTLPLADATVGSTSLSWVLTQAQTLLLKDGKNAEICLDWILTSGTRGIGKTLEVNVGSSAVNEVIEL